MPVSVESLQGLERRMTIILSSEQIDQAMGAELRQQAKSLRLNGFRPGKVPLAIVKQQQGTAVRQQVLNQLMKKHFEQATKQQSLHPAGRVSFTPMPESADNDFSYQADFEVYPEITVQSVADIIVEKPQVEITENDITEHLQKMQRVLATWDPVERTATLEDRVTLNFTGTIEGKPFEGGRAQNFVCNLGQDRVIDGFATGIVGHQAGDEFTLDIPFPIDYISDELQGKTAQFFIQLTQVEACTLPEWSPEMLQEMGVEGGSAEELKAIVRKSLESQRQKLIQQYMKKQLINQLFEAHREILVPSTLVNEQLEYSVFQIEKTGRKLKTAEREELRQDIERRVAIGLLISAVIQQRSLQLDETRVERYWQENIMLHNKPEKLAVQYRQDPDVVERLCSEVLEDQVVEMLLEEVTITEKSYTLSELIQQID